MEKRNPFEFHDTDMYVACVERMVEQITLILEKDLSHL